MGAKEIILIAACVGASLLMIFKFGRENKVFIGAGLLCLMVGGYYTAVSLFKDWEYASAFGWVLRGGCVLLLIWMTLVLRNERAKSRAQNEASTAQGQVEETGDSGEAEEAPEEKDEPDAE